MKRLIAALLAFVVFSPAHAAGSPPKTIWGKSFVVSAEQVSRQRILPDGNWYDRQLTRTIELYISSTGRVFKRERVVAYGGYQGNGPGGRGRGGGRSVNSGSQDEVGGEDTSGSRLNVDFGQNSIAVTTLARGAEGARQTAIQFDGAIQSCQATMLQGKGRGAGTYFARSSTSGRDVEVDTVSSSAARCSIRDGNVFE